MGGWGIVGGHEHEARPEPAAFTGRWWIPSARLPISWTVREPLALSLVLDQNTVRFYRKGVVLVRADRNEVDELEFQTRAPGVGLLGAELRVRFVDGAYGPAVMVPSAPRELGHWLEQHGWPVEVRMADPPRWTDIRARPTDSDGRTEPGSVYRREGTSTTKAVLSTALLALIVGGFVGVWLYAAVGPGGPDWQGYVTAVLDGDEPAAGAHLCEDIRTQLRRLDGGFEQARTQSLERFDGPVERYAGQRRGGSAFELEEGRTVVHAIPWSVENDEPRVCPTDPSALLGDPA